MFKRRLAVLGAVCALALTGLAGSALADEPPATAGGKATCTTSDGKTIELPEAQPGKPMGIMVTSDGEVKKVDPDEMWLRAVPAEKLPEGAEPPVPAEKLPEGAEPPVLVKKAEAAPGHPIDIKDIKVEAGAGVGVAEARGGKPEKAALTIICKKAE
ncbi:hypothetical protein [Nonomuraea sp. NPDC049480]|uniref:hypothetical protein n=1 Tax=Nonomuraea sp. NPDC049480 TaxID=3364353 RepID=UPI0037B5902B